MALNFARILVFKTIILSFFLCFQTQSYSQTCPPQPKIQAGDMVIACQTTGGDPTTLAIKHLQGAGELYDQGVTGVDVSDQLPPTTITFSEWELGGEVFSVTLDQDFNIYTVTSGIYGYGSAPGVVSKIDAITCQVTELATLPGTTGGAAIEYDTICNQLFVTNFEDGKIYRIDPATGNTLSTFDPLGADDGITGYAPLGERIFALAFNPVDGRLYYSVWGTDRIDDTNALNTNRNTVRSVAIDPNTHDFITATDKLELSAPYFIEYGIPNSTQYYSMPIADIEFNAAGTSMLLAEVGMNSTFQSTSHHNSRLLEYNGSSTGGWTHQSALPAGNTRYYYEVGTLGTGSNSRGGTDFAYGDMDASGGCTTEQEEFIVVTGDALMGVDCGFGECVYGIQYLSENGGNYTNSVLIDGDGYTYSQEKGVFGDVDVITGCNDYVACTASELVLPSCGASDGSAIVNPVRGTAPYTYLWSDGQTTQSATNLPYGIYSVTVTDANNCTTVCETELISPGTPSETCDITAPTIETTVSDLISGTTESQSLGSSWTNLGNAGAVDTDYTTLINMDRSSVSSRLEIAPYSMPTPDCAILDSVRVVFSGYYVGPKTITDYSVRVENSLGGTLLSLTGGGHHVWSTTEESWSYTVNNVDWSTLVDGIILEYRVETGGGSPGTGSAYLNYAGIEVFYTPTFTICNDATNQVFTTSSIATADNYTWTVPAGASVTSGQGTTSATVDFGSMVGGTYDICVAPSNLCGPAPQCCYCIVVEECVPPVIGPICTASSTETVCEGATISVNETGGDATSWSWSGPNGFTSFSQNPTISSSATTAMSGTYSVTVSDASTATSECTTTITVNANPSATTTATSPTCSGTTPNSDGTITLSGFTTGDKYDFNIGGTYTGTATYATGSTSIAAGGVITNTEANPTTSQIYTVRIFNSSGCYTDINVTILETSCACTDPILTDLTDETICFGSSFTTSNVTTSVTNGVSVTYQWYDNNGTNNPGTNAMSGQTTATLTALPTAAGSYSYIVEATNTGDGTCKATKVVNLTVENQPEAGAQAGPLTICETSTTSITLSGELTGADTGGTWTEGTNPTGGSFTSAAGTFDPTGASVGTYTFTYSFAAANGCAADDAIVSIIVENQAEAGSQATPMIVCESSTTSIALADELTGDDTGGAWTAGGTNPTGGTFTSATGTFDPTGASVGTYTFTYSLSGGTACAVDNAVVTIQVTSQPEAGAQASPLTICETSTTNITLSGELTGADTGGTWTAGGTNPIGGTFTAATGTFDPTGASVGTYTFTYSFAAGNGCAADDAIVSIIVENQAEAGSQATTMIVCESSTTSITLADELTGEDAGGTWTAGGTNPTGGTFTSATGTFDPTGASVGTYTFTYSLSAGTECAADNAVVSIQVTTPLCSISGNNSITPSAQDEIYTGPVGMTTYAWAVTSGDAVIDGASNTQSVTIDFGALASSISLTVTDANGCMSTCVISPAAGEFDLALEKDLALGQLDTISIGDDVDYAIKVINEGGITATNIEVCDILPAGMVLSPLDVNGWDDTNPDTVYYTIVGPIVAGDSLTVNIKLRVVYGGQGGSLTNIAEITDAQDGAGNVVTDIDSTPENGVLTEDDIDPEVIQLLDNDPTGWVYCDKTGKIITGGTITVTGPNGIPNDEVAIIHDGSDGYYEFYAIGLAGVYTITYTHPDGVTLSITKLATTPALDPTALASPVVLGVDTLAEGMYLSDTSFVSNPYYLQFDMELGDPPILLNNLPVQCVVIGSTVCLDDDFNHIDDGDEPAFTAGSTVNLYDCADMTTVIASTVTDVNGAYTFDGLIAGDYMLQFVPPAGYSFMASQADTLVNGFTSCMNLNWGECDTTRTVCYTLIRYDLGDLPDATAGTGAGNYETLLSNNGPSHIITPGLYLGASVDNELDGQPDATASGDGSDEDLAAFTANLNLAPGNTLTLPLSVTNTTGSTAYLEAWIDWNGDGDFNDPDEMVLNLDDNAGSFPSTYEITIPVDATLSTDLGVRFRLSNEDNMTPYGLAGSGEVEDYLISVECKEKVCLPINININK